MKRPHAMLRRGNAAPTEVDAIPQGGAGCPQPGAGEHQGRAPRLAAQEGQSLLVLHGHHREQDAAAGACRLPQGCSARGGRTPALGTRTRRWPGWTGWWCQTPVALHGVALRTPPWSPGQCRAVTSRAPVLCSPSPLKDDDVPSRSRAWTPAPRTPSWQTPHRAWTPACRTPARCTPYRAGDSFVGSVLKAASGKGELGPAGWFLGVPVWGWASLPPTLGMCAGRGGDPSAIHHSRAFPCGFPSCSVMVGTDWVTGPVSGQGLL